MVLFPMAFSLFFIAIFALLVGAMVFWIYSLVEVARIPDYQYRAAGTDKLTWVLLVVLVQFIGAVIWRVAKRAEVQAQAGAVPPAPPGWYPDPATGAPRWWDGYRWSLPGPPPA